MRRATIPLLLLLLMVAGAEAGKKDADDDDDARERLKLRASVQAGFAPLTIHFTGRLLNVDAEDETFCHAGTFLMLRTRDGDMRVVAGEDPRCLHDPEESHVPLTFSHSFVVSRAGAYEFVSMVRRKDGHRIISNGVPVRVLSNPATD